MLPNSENKTQVDIAYPFAATFEIPFKYWLETEVFAVLSFDDGSDPTSLVNGVDFSVSAPGDSGTLTKITDWDHDANHITIYRWLDLDQETDYTEGQAGIMETIERDFDRTIAKLQQLQEEITRGLILDVSEPSQVLDFPTAAERRGRFLAFEDTEEADPIAADPVNVPVTAFMQTLLDDATAATGRATLDAAQGSLIGKSPFAPITGYTPTERDVVEMYSDGTIRKAKRINSAILANGSTVAAARVSKLDATHAIVLYAVGLVIKAVLLTVDPKDLSIIYGTPYDVFTCTTTLAAFDIAFVDSTHVLAATSVTGGAASFTQGTVRILNVDVGAGTIGPGSTAACSATSNSMALYNIPGSSNILLAYMKTTTTLAWAVISGGTTPVYNAEATHTPPAAVSLETNNPLNITVSNDGVAAVVLVSGTSPYNLSLYPVSISGTTVTARTRVDLLVPSLSGLGYPAIEEGPGNVWTILAVVSSAGTHPYALAWFNIRRTGTNAVAAPFSSSGHIAPWGVAFGPYSTMGVTLRAIDRSTGLLAIHAPGLSSDGNVSSRQWIARRRGLPLVLQFTDDFVWSIGSTAQVIAGVDMLSSEITVFAVGTGTVSTSRIITQRRRNTVVGLAIDGAGTVQREGSFITTGLIAGKKYFADDNGDISTVESEVEIGFAKSTTELELAIRGGI